jgi:RNA polymerase sigma-70 factor (ECF subfamily)
MLDFSLDVAALTGTCVSFDRPHRAAERLTADGELARVLESFRGELTRFAFWLARDRTAAEDLVQETMLRAWRSRGTLREQTALRPWLFTIARREHARLYQRKRLPLVNIDEPEFGQDEALTYRDEDPQIEELRRAILRLSDDYRIPLLMQVLGGFTTAEIATELKLTPTAALTRLYRARNQLRDIYGVAAESSAPRAAS